MSFKFILFVSAQILLIKIISSQYISNAETMGPSLIPDVIGIPEGLTLGSNLVANNLPIGPNMPTNLPIGPNIVPNSPLGSNIAGNLPLPLNNIAIGSNIGMPVGSNMINNLALTSNWPVGSGFNRLSYPGSISPAAMAPPKGIAASNGGSFTVTSSSPIAPTGLTVNSENAIEGSLIVSGQLPFLGSVGMDGAFPTVGGGMVSYGCGDGNIGMVNEGTPSGPMGQTLAPAASPALGFGTGMLGGQFNGLPGRGFNGLY